MKLCVTYCSGQKSDGTLPPDKLYKSRRIDQFAEYCKANSLKWAIISAKYGLFFPEERRERYDATLKSAKGYRLGIKVIVNGEDGEEFPKDKSDAWIDKLIETIRTQVTRHSVDEIVFYTWSLKQPKCYLVLLHFIVDTCDVAHSWSQLLECVERHGRIHVTTQLNFAP
ncbi:hypothetical protein COZ60_01955 [Candidatus Bathyarchaeota archaeon CG_4_8_14_3_um_filter_42_8]|nr:MAG: hypothetical protein COZ60_01955 [Candidatus Bathyarchaeota archaeon CG_4_8_14_3_um_filter_42_8]